MLFFKKKDKIKELEKTYISAFTLYLKTKKAFKLLDKKIVEISPKKVSSVFSQKIKVIYTPKSVFVDEEKLKNLYPEIYPKVLKERADYSYSMYIGEKIEV